MQVYKIQSTNTLGIHKISKYISVDVLLIAHTNYCTLPSLIVTQNVDQI